MSSEKQGKEIEPANPEGAEAKKEADKSLSPVKGKTASASKVKPAEKADEQDDLEEAKEPPTKRKKLADGAEEGKDDAADEEFDAKAAAAVGDEDSFDEDFGADEDEEPHGEDDEFDVEAYLKWRKEHPDEVDDKADPNGEISDDDEEAEAEQEGSESEDDYGEEEG